MKRYRQRTANQASLVGPAGGPIDIAALFGRQAPLRLEIGFGHGRFLSQMAAAHPDEDFLGVEHKDLRVTKTAHWSHRRGADNVRLFHDDAHRFVRERLPAASLKRVYILFPDPWPKRRHRRRRLVNRAFLIDLAHALAPGGRLVFASDSQEYAFHVLSHLSTIADTWVNHYLPAGYQIDIPTRFPTVFEEHRKREGHRVAYLLCSRRDTPPPDRASWPRPRYDE